MKKSWIVLRVVGVCVCLFVLIASVRSMRVMYLEINKVQTETDQAWSNLERAAPLLAKEYHRAIKKKTDDVAVYSFGATFLALPLVLLSTSLLWQFVVVPIRTRWTMKQLRSLTAD